MNLRTSHSHFGREEVRPSVPSLTSTGETTRVLIAQYEPTSARVLLDHLESLGGFEASCLQDGRFVIPKIRAWMPRLVLLDVLLQGKDGLAICRELRAFSEIPVIIVSDCVKEVDRLNGFQAGANDYVCKPFSLRELTARIRNVLRRPAAHEATPCQPRLSVDDDRFEVHLDGRCVDLTAVEFRLLRALARHPGRVYSRDELLGRVYTDRRVVYDRTIDSHIKNLRRKLEQVTPGNAVIKSVYGLGYRLDLPPTEITGTLK